jgi:hypothetical protein
MSRAHLTDDDRFLIDVGTLATIGHRVPARARVPAHLMPNTIQIRQDSPLRRGVWLARNRCRQQRI